MKRKVPHATLITVLGVNDGKKVTLLDRRGRALCRDVSVTKLEGPIDYRLAQKRIWERVANWMRVNLYQRTKQRPENPWQARANNLATSFTLRSYDLSRPGARRHFETYPTTTWKAASKRMWEQGHNRYRRHTRSGWARWSSTVSNNHNKRKGGRYAKTQNVDKQDGARNG